MPARSSRRSPDIIASTATGGPPASIWASRNASGRGRCRAGGPVGALIELITAAARLPRGLRLVGVGHRQVPHGGVPSGRGLLLHRGAHLPRFVHGELLEVVA